MAEIADLAARTHEPISTDCEVAEEEIRKLTAQLKIAMDCLEYIADEKHLVPFVKTIAYDALIQISAVE